MSMHPTGRHDATRGTYATCGILLLLAVLLVLWAFRGGPFNEPTPSAPTPTPLYVVIVTPDTAPPPPVPTGVPTDVPPAVPTAQVPPPLPTRVLTAVPEPVPSGVPTSMVLGAIALHDGPVPLFGMPCWSKSRNPHPSCTPTPFPPGSPTGTAVPTDTPTPTTAPTGTAVPTGSPTPCVGTYWECQGTAQEFADRLTVLINQHRVSIGILPLARSTPLDLAQQEWAVYIVGPPEHCEHGDFGARAISYGYTGFPFGEAGACGYSTPEDTLQGWLDSPGHRGIVEAGAPFGIVMRDIGVGVKQYPVSRRWTAWILVGGPY